MPWSFSLKRGNYKNTGGRGLFPTHSLQLSTAVTLPAKQEAEEREGMFQVHTISSASVRKAGPPLPPSFQEKSEIHHSCTYSSIYSSYKCLLTKYILYARYHHRFKKISALIVWQACQKFCFGFWFKIECNGERLILSSQRIGLQVWELGRRTRSCNRTLLRFLPLFKGEITHSFGISLVKIENEAWEMMLLGVGKQNLLVASREWESFMFTLEIFKPAVQRITEF